MLFDSILSPKISENIILMVYYEIRHLDDLGLWQVYDLEIMEMKFELK